MKAFGASDALGGDTCTVVIGFPGPENGVAVKVKFRVADPVLMTWMLACAVLPGQALQRISQTQRGGHSISGISQQGLGSLGISIFGRVAVTSSLAASIKSRVVFADIDTSFGPSSNRSFGPSVAKSCSKA